jgi:HSP20 family molecular chaperone IbpA
LADFLGLRVEDYMADGLYLLRVELPGQDPDREVMVAATTDRTLRLEAAPVSRGGRSLRWTAQLPPGADTERIEVHRVGEMLEIRVPITSPQAQQRGVGAETSPVPR